MDCDDCDSDVLVWCGFQGFGYNDVLDLVWILVVVLVIVMIWRGFYWF